MTLKNFFEKNEKKIYSYKSGLLEVAFKILQQFVNTEVNYTNNIRNMVDMKKKKKVEYF
jgi:hypothetical protein